MKIIASIVLFSSLANADIAFDIAAEATKQGIDPKIAIAVATVESGLNPKAVGKAGEVGVFQLHPSFFKATNTRQNIRLGIKHLAYWKAHCPVREGYEWVTCYNQGSRHPKYPKLFPYYKKVAAVMQ
jgi:hypothetical protein